MRATKKNFKGKMYHFGENTFLKPLRNLAMFLAKNIATGAEIKDVRGLMAVVYNQALGPKKDRKNKRLREFSFLQLISVNLALFVLYKHAHEVKVIKEVDIPQLSSKHKAKGRILPQGVQTAERPEKPTYVRGIDPHHVSQEAVSSVSVYTRSSSQTV